MLLLGMRDRAGDEDTPGSQPWPRCRPWKRPCNPAGNPDRQVRHKGGEARRGIIHGKAVPLRFTTLVLVLLAAGLLVGGVPGVALAQSAPGTGAPATQTPSDGLTEDMKAGWPDPDVGLASGPAADEVAMKVRKDVGAASEATETTADQSAPGRSPVPVTGD